jgi:hypothetical protein
MNKYFKIYSIILRHYGFKLRPLATFGQVQMRHMLSAGTRGLDHLFYPAFRDVPIDRPIFLIGNPRSGTTFVHRFLLNSERLCAFELWEMLLPAITARKALGGIVDRFAPFSPAKYHGSEAHETSLRDVETDDVLEFFHFMDGGFLWAYFLAWDDTWGSDLSRRYFDLEAEPAATKEALWRYLEGCWRRNMYMKGRNRVIVKSPMHTLRVRTLLERYPDCKLIYIARDPIQTLASGMSLITGVLEQAYGLPIEKAKPESRERYLENLYQSGCKLYRVFDDMYKAGEIPEKNLMIVSYPRLLTDLGSVMTELIEFLEIEPVPAFFEKLRQQTEKQRTYKSSHKYSLEKFGLDADRIRQDLDFMYRDYAVS